MKGRITSAVKALASLAWTSWSADVVYLDAVTTFCYESLIADGSCCRDTTHSAGIASMEVKRRGALWECVPPMHGGRCLDERTGSRGTDWLWWPEGADCTTPRILYIHGGDWMFYGPEEGSYNVLASKLAHETGAVVMIPDYPLVPQGNYSTIMSWLLKSWAWLADHGPGAKDCSSVARPPAFVAGDSAGGGTGLSLLLHSQLADGQQASGFVGFSPWANLACDTPSYYSNAFAQLDDRGGTVDYVGDILARGAPHSKAAALREVAEAYLGSKDFEDPQGISSPFHASSAQLQRLPPLYLAVSGTESRSGDSIILASRAAKQGVPVAVDIFYGMWHAFPLYSEGCGSGHALWHATAVLSHVGDFVRQVAHHETPSSSLPRLLRQTSPRMMMQHHEKPEDSNLPQMNVYYSYPTWHEPWIPVRPLSMRSLDQRRSRPGEDSRGTSSREHRGSKGGPHAPAAASVLPETPEAVPLRPVPREPGAPASPVQRGPVTDPAAPGRPATDPAAPQAVESAPAVPAQMPGSLPQDQKQPPPGTPPPVTSPVGTPPAGTRAAAIAAMARQEHVRLPPQRSPGSEALPQQEGKDCQQAALAGAFLTGVAGGAICTALAAAATWWHCSDRHGLCVRKA